MYFGENDTQSELYIPEDRENVNFDNFTGFEKSVKKFYDSPRNFENSNKPFFDAIVYGIMHTVGKNKIILKERDKVNYEGLIVEGNMKPDKKRQGIFLEKFENLIDIKDEIQLDRNLFGFFNRCFLVNELLSKYNYFLKFYERRDKFRFLMNKKLERKNKVTRDFSSSVIEKFNGYEAI